MGVVTNVVTWRGIGERKTANSLRISGLLWCHQDSNRGHTDFQSDALPTELWHHLLRFCDAKLGVLFELCKFSRVFYLSKYINTDRHPS